MTAARSRGPRHAFDAVAADGQPPVRLHAEGVGGQGERRGSAEQQAARNHEWRCRMAMVTVHEGESPMPPVPESCNRGSASQTDTPR
jgi:hypothetical protein